MTTEDPFTLKYDARPETVLSFRLVVANGPLAGHAFEVSPTEPRIVLGTGQGCTIVLGDPHVSRRHVALVPGADRIDLEDLGSSNGTWVNGVEVHECALRGGELLRVGDTTLRVENLGPRDVKETSGQATFGRALGTSRVMRALFVACERLAQTSSPVLIEGETGTGKELLAESIHQAGPRRDRPFIVFDPALFVDGSAAHVLFGTTAAAAGGAAQAGLFERADGGTLLIDGPADIPPDLQRKLVRAVERGEVQPIGSDRTIKVDVRVVTTSLLAVDRAIEDGRLREDLAHRLCGVRLSIPPLRKRREDIPLLIEHFWKTLGGGATPIPPALVSRWEEYSWPGNVRELQNVVAREIVLGNIAIPDDPTVKASPIDVDLPFPQARQLAIAQFESAYVERLLEKHGGNVARASAASGVAHRYFQILKARHRR